LKPFLRPFLNHYICLPFCRMKKNNVTKNNVKNNVWWGFKKVKRNEKRANETTFFRKTVSFWHRLGTFFVRWFSVELNLGHYRWCITRARYYRFDVLIWLCMNCDVYLRNISMNLFKLLTFSFLLAIASVFEWLIVIIIAIVLNKS
jgi:hypothetical protein